MKLEIVSKKENPLFERTEVVAKLSGYESTPSNIQVGEQVAHAMKTEKEKVFIIKIGQSYGKTASKVEAHIYKTPEALAKTVHAKHRLRTLPKGEKPAGAKKKK